MDEKFKTFIWNQVLFLVCLENRCYFSSDLKLSRSLIYFSSIEIAVRRSFLESTTPYTKVAGTICMLLHTNPWSLLMSQHQKLFFFHEFSFSVHVLQFRIPNSPTTPAISDAITYNYGVHDVSKHCNEVIIVILEWTVKLMDLMMTEWYEEVLKPLGDCTEIIVCCFNVKDREAGHILVILMVCVERLSDLRWIFLSELCLCCS